jgi:hypothetical protein
MITSLRYLFFDVTYPDSNGLLELRLDPDLI